MDGIAFFTGALLPTFFISRFILWVIRHFQPRTALVALVANAASLAVATLLLWLSESLAYIWNDVAAQSVWLAMDLFRYRKKKT
jgi:hypothetical protein